MIRLVLACLVLFPDQNPDRSTPEKAFENFSEFYHRTHDNWERLRSETEALADFLRTDDLKARKKKQADEEKAEREDRKILSMKVQMIGKTENKDGTVTVEAMKTEKRRQKNLQSGKVEEIEEKTPQRLVMEKSGAIWYVRQIFNACMLCSGEGVCGHCKGTGVFHDNACDVCEGGKTCRNCKGEKLTELNLVGRVPEFVIPDGELQYSQDLSSPKAAAQSLADLKLRQEIHSTELRREFTDLATVEFHLYFHPTIMKQREDTYAKGVEDGKRRYREERTTVQSVEEKGDVAYVRLKTKEDDEIAPRFVIKKVGDKWLLDAEQRKCFLCKGLGTCDGCEGTGKSGDADCYLCNGVKKCKTCKGEGWLED